MALPFDRINTRKLALAAEYGYAAGDVAEDGIDEDGITVLISAYMREKRPSAYASYESQSPFVQVQWETSDQAELARKACDDDWIETLARAGLTPADLLD